MYEETTSQPYTQFSDTHDKENLINEVLNNEDIFTIMEHDLRGEVYNSETSKWEQKGRQWMNDEGSKAIVSICRSYANRVVQLSNFNDKEIKKNCLSLNLKLIQYIKVKHKSFDIDKYDISIIIEKIMIICFSAMKSSLDEGMRETLFRGVTERRVVMPAEQENTGFLGKMFK